MFDELRDLYQTIILDRSRNPQHMHRLEPFDASAEGDNPLCGDRVEVRIRLDGDSRIAETAFEARGCAISVASADLMAETVHGRNADEIRALAAEFEALVRSGTTPHAHLQTLLPLAGVSEYPSRIKCATLPWAALVAALAGRKEASSEHA